jgi:hypothetical protein
MGDAIVSVEIRVDSTQRWHFNGAECPQVKGCIDIDLNFSPSTNLLPIRRLQLDVDEEADVNAAWLRFPGFELERLPQLYRRVGETAYRYESGGGKFVANLAVNSEGFVVNYPGIWLLVIVWQQS